MKLAGLLEFQGKPTWLAGLLSGVLIVGVVFPDVLFRGATFSMLDLANAPGAPRVHNQTLRKLIPDRVHRVPQDGYSDYGGAAWQSEPAIQFMRYCLVQGESPYWNPYSATGALGPETLVDLKFSPLTILVALCGGSVLAFHLVALSLYVMAIAFLFRVLTHFFDLSIRAALAACLVYVLNGYSIANLSSNVAQAYLYYPLSLHALCCFARQPSVGHYVAAIAAQALLLAATFLPTTALLIGATAVLAAAYALHVSAGKRACVLVILGQWSSLLWSALLLALIYFPILDSFTFLKTAEMCEARRFYAANILAGLSMFTPKHFWESYGGMDSAIQPFIQNVIFHFGIVASMIVVQVWASARARRNLLVVASSLLLVVALGRIFAVPVIAHVVDWSPFTRSIGCQYWWIVVAFSFTFLFAFGFQALVSEGAQLRPALALAGLIVLDASYLWTLYWKGTPGFLSGSYFGALSGVNCLYYFVVSSLFLLASLGLLYRQRERSIPVMQALLVGLMFLELFSYMNRLRYLREDIFRAPPEHVVFLKENLGDQRIMEYGTRSVFPELGAAYQLPQLGSMNMNIIPSYVRFYEQNFLAEDDKGRWGQFCVTVRDTEPRVNQAALDMVGVKYIVVQRNFAKVAAYFERQGYPKVFDKNQVLIYENRNHYPRAFAVPRLLASSAQAELSSYGEAAFTDDERFLEQARALGVTGTFPVTRGTDRPADVELTAYHHARVELGVTCRQPCVVVLTDCWHPAWKAFVDGAEVPVGRVNGTFRGIALPPGNHAVEFKYLSKAVHYGVVISAVIAAGLLVALVFRKRLDGYLKSILAPRASGANTAPAAPPSVRAA